MQRAVLTVDLSRIASNFSKLKARLGHDVCAVIKADAYGLGAIPVAKTLEKAGCRWFAVATMEEAVELRAAGIAQDVLLLGPAAQYSHEDVQRLRLTPWIASRDDLTWMGRLPDRTGVHIKIDTGMNRLGLSAAEAYELIRMHPGRVRAVATHFACADNPAHPMNAEQKQRLSEFMAGLGPSQLPLHASNTALALTEPPAGETMSRIGLGLYGVNPVMGVQAGLSNVIGLRATVVAVREVAAGQSISYGAEYVASRAMRVGVVGIGYADGLPVSLSGKPMMLRTGGGDAPIVGRITMDLCMVDLTDLPSAHTGNEVVVIDSEQPERVRQIAQASGRLPYEVLIGLGNRVERVYIP